MNALDRAERDEEAGDLGSARRRLMSYVTTVGYSPSLCERIARLCTRMGDPVEAGRWYFLSDSRDPEAGPAVGRFTADCGGDPRAVASRLPAKLRLARVEEYPPGVRARFEGLGLRGPPGSAVLPPVSRSSIAGPIGCILGLLFGIACVVVGAITILRWILARVP